MNHDLTVRILSVVMVVMVLMALAPWHLLGGKTCYLTL
jgi:hypothetical protein